MTTIGERPPPKVGFDNDRGLITVNGDEGWTDHHFVPYSPVGRALLELIERRAANVVGVAVDRAPEPIAETPLRALVGYANDARADIAEAVGVCATNDAAEALTQALAHMNAVVRLCGVAAVKDAS